MVEGCAKSRDRRSPRAAAPRRAGRGWREAGLVLLLASCLCRAAAAAPTAIEVGYYDAKPSCFRDAQGRPRGIFISVIDEIAQREGWTVTYSFRSWGELLEGLRTGSVDLVPAIVRTPEREAFAAFTRESVMSDWGTLFARPGGGLDSVLDLGGKRVGALEDDFWFSGPGSLKGLCASFGVSPDYRYYPDYPSLFRALARGDIDAAAGSNSLGIVWTPDLPVVATSIVYNPIELRLAASRKSPDGAELARRLDLALTAIRASSPEVFSEALAEFQVPLRREFRAPPWLLAALAAMVAVLLVVTLLLAAQKRALAASERRFRGLFENSPLPIWEEDFHALKRRIDAERAGGSPDWEAFFAEDAVVAEHLSLVKVLDVNRATLDLLRYPDKEALLGSLGKIFDPRDLASLRPELEALARGDLAYEGKTFHVDALGGRVPVQIKLQMLPGYEESWSRALVSVVDLSERSRAEEILRHSIEEKELLLREIHHRVKNNLQVVCSLIGLQLGEDGLPPQAKDSLLDMETRVRSMSLVHELLYRSDDFAAVEFAAYLASLVDNLRDAYCERGEIGIEVEAEEVRLPLERAIPCGLLVNELVVNAIKHAFPDGRRGRIEVRMARAGDGGVSLSVRDDGAGMRKPPTGEAREGLGLSLARNLASQLGGLLRAEAPPEGGLSVVLEFPEN